jgi:4-amino-4-deoxy-L-arabinose transferase-like glycosyltransferase
LGAVLALAFLLYVWRIGADGYWGNPFYAAAVKAMAHDPKAFLFGGYDAAGVLSIDKPAIPLWPQAILVAVFGYHSWALLLPQVIEGVLTVFVLHRAVRRWAGSNAALLAATVLALTPITVAINRDNNPDTLLMLLLVSAAYALIRGIGDGLTPAARTRWLLLAAFGIGCGFNAKMMQAWTVVPGFALAWLVHTAVPLRRRVLDLLGGGVVLAASSLWWVVLTSVWPQPKPFMGGSASGSAWNLIVGYNGLGRIFANNDTTGSTGESAKLLTGLLGEIFGGAPGPFRLFAPILGGQISWLLPAAVLLLVAVLVARFRGVAGRPAGWAMWGGWLIGVAIIFSIAKGMFHPYYTTTLAPPIAALFAAGIVTAWGWYRRRGPLGWWLPAVVAVTTVWAFVLVDRDPSWNGWLRWVVLTLGVVAVAGLVLAVRDRRLGGPALAAAVAACLVAPGVWALTTGFGPSYAFLGAGNVSAGPYVLPPYFEQFGEASAAQTRTALSHLAGPKFSNVSLNDRQQKLLGYVAAGNHSPIDLGVEGGAVWAGRYVVSSEMTVVAFGGYEAKDPVPTPAELASWVRDGRIRYILSSSRTVQGIPQPDPFAGGPAPTGDALKATRTVFAPLGGAAELSRIQWVQANCTEVPPATYGVTAEADITASKAGFNTLYDCRPA